MPWDVSARRGPVNAKIQCLHGAITVCSKQFICTRPFISCYCSTSAIRWFSGPDNLDVAHNANERWFRGDLWTSQRREQTHSWPRAQTVQRSLQETGERPGDLTDVVASAWRLYMDSTWFHAIICINRSSRDPVTVCGIFCSTFMVVLLSLSRSLSLSLCVSRSLLLCSIGSSVSDVSKLETNSCLEVPKIKCTDHVIISLDTLRNNCKLPLFKAR